jgi:hypothetical protein
MLRDTKASEEFNADLSAFGELYKRLKLVRKLCLKAESNGPNR